MKKIRRVFTILCMVLFLLALGFCAGQRFLQNDSKKKVDASYIESEIQQVSELVTAELSYRGLVRISDGEIPLLTKKAFSMIYTANLTAGTDLSQVAVELTDTQAIITVPVAELTGLQVKTDSIEFYDEQWALFNWGKKTDVTDAIHIAEEDAKKSADLDGLLKRADEQSIHLLTVLVTPLVGEREVTVSVRNA